VVLNKAEIAEKEVAHSQIAMRRERIEEEADSDKTTPIKPDNLRRHLEAQEKKPGER